ncbi:MAG: hypothetical protein ACM30G_08095, partial [Micromonosporaceae bacterium]
MRVESAADAGAVSAGAEAGWVTFRRSDATAVIGMVRAVAAGHDAGEHGDGVEGVVETPRPGWLARRLGRQRAQARM